MDIRNTKHQMFIVCQPFYICMVYIQSNFNRINSVTHKSKSESKKMPIFSKKFDPKSIPQRGKRDASCTQIHEKLDDFNVIKLNLTNKKELKFVDGKWILNHQQANTVDVTVMRKRLQKLEEENNLNRIKVEILLDMLTENLAELNILRDQ